MPLHLLNACMDLRNPSLGLIKTKCFQVLIDQSHDHSGSPDDDRESLHAEENADEAAHACNTIQGIKQASVELDLKHLCLATRVTDLRRTACPLAYRLPFDRERCTGSVRS